MLKYVLLVSTLIVTIGCGGVTYPTPVSLHSSCRLGPIGSRISNSTGQLFLAAKLEDGTYIVCTQNSKELYTVSAIDTSLNIRWTTTVPMPDDYDHVSLMTFGDSVSVLFDNEVSDTIYVSRQVFHASTGISSPKVLPFAKVLDNESLTVVYDPMLKRSVLRSVGMIQDSTNAKGDSEQWLNYRLMNSSSTTLIPAHRLPISKRHLQRSEMLEPSTGSYVVASIRDSVDKDPTKTPNRFIETSIVGATNTARHRFSISDVFENEKAETVVPFLGIRDNVLQLHTVASTEDNAIASVSRFDYNGSDWKLSWSHDFTKVECEKIDDDLDWELAKIHGIYHLSNGTLVFIEEVHALQGTYTNPSMYLPPQSYMYFPPRMPTSFRYDPVMSSSTIERGVSSYSSKITLAVFISNDGKVRWHTALSRSASDKAERHVMTTGLGDDGRILIGTERNGSCPILWRDYVNGTLYAGLIDLSNGTINGSTSVMHIDVTALWYGLSWTNDHSFMFFTYVSGGVVIPVQIDLNKLTSK